MSSTKNPLIRRVTMIAAVVAIGAQVLGCASLNNDKEEEEPGDPQALREQARDFHTNLRWARYEHAAGAVHEAYRSTFEGRYEERGQDYEIVGIEMKDAEIREGGRTAHVEVEQKWYELPSTVVESERFVERWIWENQRWQLRERLRRDEFRERDETFDSAKTTEDAEPTGDEENESAGP